MSSIDLRKKIQKVDEKLAEERHKLTAARDKYPTVANAFATGAGSRAQVAEVTEAITLYKTIVDGLEVESSTLKQRLLELEKAEDEAEAERARNDRIGEFRAILDSLSSEKVRVKDLFRELCFAVFKFEVRAQEAASHSGGGSLEGERASDVAYRALLGAHHDANWLWGELRDSENLKAPTASRWTIELTVRALVPPTPSQAKEGAKESTAEEVEVVKAKR